MLQNASEGSALAVQQKFKTPPIFDVYSAYAGMSGDLACVEISAAQSAPLDAVAAIYSVGAKAAWILLGQALNVTSPFSRRRTTLR